MSNNTLLSVEDIAHIKSAEVSVVKVYKFIFLFYFI